MLGFIAPIVLSLSLTVPLPAPGGHAVKSPLHRVAPPLCVSTVWRSKHTHKPLTRIGQRCRATPDMWIPDTWALIEYWGGDQFVYEREA